MKSVEALRNWADGLRGIWIDPNDHSIIVTTCDDMPPSMDCVSLREHVNGILDEIEREVDDMWHAPTVEDVLAEMLDVWGELPSNVTNEAIVAEYAAKLRLAGDE